MKLTDEMIVDQTPIADKYVKKYKKKHQGGGIASPQNPAATSS